MNIIKKIRDWFNESSTYGIWETAFENLQKEKKTNGKSKEYWRIWYEEVCPAYQKLTDETPKLLRHPLTDKILFDMTKPVSERKYL